MSVRYVWRRCKCTVCGVIHTDVMPEHTPLQVPKVGRPFTRAACDLCLERLLGRPAAAEWKRRREMIVNKHLPSREE